MKRSFVAAACLSLIACATMLPVAAQDLAKTAPKNVKVLLDNDQVRVLELQMPPGASTGMHSHGDNFVYFITGGTAKQTQADGSVKETTRKPGEAMWSGPVTHDTVNAGSTAVKTLVVELKQPKK